MKSITKKSVSQMRVHLIKFLAIAASIDDEDWIQVIKSVQKDKERLTRMKSSGELGNVYVMLFFLNEILESVVEESP